MGMDPVTIGLGAMALGTVLSAGSQLKAGDEADAAGKYNQAALNTQANNEEAASQRQAIDKRRQAALASSRAQAVAAASGGGASDTTVVNTIADIEGQGEFQALSDLYNGAERGSQLRQQGAMARYEGRQAQKASRVQAATTVLSGASSMFTKYNSPVKGADPNGITWDNSRYYG